MIGCSAKTSVRFVRLFGQMRCSVTIKARCQIMNTTEKSAARWFRFAQVGSIILLCLLVMAGIDAPRILEAEAAKLPVMMLAGGLLFIAIELWGIFFLLMMAILDRKCRAA